MPDESNPAEVQADALLAESLQGMLIRTVSGTLTANDVFCELFGYTREELRALDFLQLYHPDDRGIIAARMQARLAGDTTKRRYEIRGLRKDSSVLWLDCMTWVTEWQGERATQLILLDITERKRAQDRLAASERKFRPAFETAPVPMLRIGRDGLLVDVNRGFEVLTGYTRHELKDRSIAAFVPEEEAPGIAAHIRSVWYYETGVAEFDHRFVRKDGSAVWVRSTISLIEAGDGTDRYLLSHVQDITARREAEAALKRSEQFFREVVANSIQGLAIVAPASGFVFVNDAFCQIFGYERAELIGGQALMLHPDTADELRLRIRARARGNDDPRRYDIRARRKDGSELWVEYLSSVTEWNGKRATLLAALDITERKLAERRLKDEELRFRELFVMAPVAMFRARGGNILDVNPAFEALVGYPAAELVGSRMRDLMPPEDAAGVPRVRDLPKNGAERLELEHRLIRKDGGVIWAAAAFSYADDRAPAERTVIAHVVDITERKLAAQRLEEQERRFRELFVMAPVAMYRTRGREIVDVNPAFEELLGYTAAELAGRTRRDLMPPEDAASVPRSRTLRRDGAGRIEVEHRMVRKDGGVIWVACAVNYADDLALAERTLIGHVVDITERRKAEQAVTERESLYRNLVEGSLQGVLIAGPNAKPLFVNDAFARMYGYEPAEILALDSTRVLYAPEELPKLEAVIAARLEGDRSVRRYEIKGVRKDGTEFWTEQLTSALDWHGQDATQVVSIEITERKEAQRRRADLRAWRNSGR